MDTPMTITAYRRDCEAALEAARTRIKQIENELSVTDEESEIARLNAGETVLISPDTNELLSFALEMCRKTGGTFDPTIYPILRAWGFTTEEFRVPEEEELQELKKLSGSDKVHINGSKVSLAPGTMIDLGGIGKGYASQKAAEILKKKGIRSAIINLGGNVQTVGRPPRITLRKHWRVGVKAPDEGELLGVLSTGECAIVTSGGYERYFVAPDGELYWHIIDPETARPARSGVMSVTVVGKDGALCDALSTAFFVMGAEKAAEFWRDHSGFDFLILSVDGLWITEGLQKRFALSKAYSDLKVKVVNR